MRRSVLALMLALCAFAVLAPVLEASCAEQCAPDAPDPCCSCCVHFKVDTPDAAGAAISLVSRGASTAPGSVRPASPDPRDILHVPKPSPA
jgi:hypothetical protein